MQHFTVVHQTA